MKKLLLALLLPASISLQAVSTLSIAKLGGAAIAGALTAWTGKAAKDIYSEGHKHNNKSLGAYYAAPYAFVSLASAVLAGLALKSALDINMDFNLKSIRIK